MVLDIATIDELTAHIGNPLGVSDWLTVDQEMITVFARVTGDEQWIHVDVERAAREMPGGKTVAQGALTLSLLARLSFSIYRIGDRRRGLNYGYERVRFLAPVQAGARIRLAQTLAAFEPIADGGRLVIDSTVEIEAAPKPALVARSILLAFR